MWAKRLCERGLTSGFSVVISFIEALEHIKANSLVLGSKYIKTSEALGFYIAQDIFAPLDLPPFDNSAVDGFAVCIKQLKTHENINY